LNNSARWSLRTRRCKHNCTRLSMRAAMRATAQFHAEEPEVRYADDSEMKRREVDEATRVATARWVEPLYELLEMARRAAAADHTGCGLC
jgi:hypothetical protein